MQIAINSKKLYTPITCQRRNYSKYIQFEILVRDSENINLVALSWITETKANPVKAYFESNLRIEFRSVKLCMSLPHCFWFWWISSLISRNWLNLYYMERSGTAWKVDAQLFILYSWFSNFYWRFDALIWTILFFPLPNSKDVVKGKRLGGGGGILYFTNSNYQN